MQPVAECPGCSALQVRLGDISERLTRIEAMLVHMTNGQLLVPTLHLHTPLSSGASSAGPSSVASAGSTSPVKVIATSNYFSLSETTLTPYACHTTARSIS